VSLFLSHELNIFSVCLNVLTCDCQFGSKRKTKYIQLKYIGLKPNCEQSEAREEEVVGRPAMSLVVRPPRGSPRGPLCRTWFSIDYLLNCIIFVINFVFVVAVCHPHTCFLYIFSAQHVETSTYQK
jgi:hypothetical protein